MGVVTLARYTGLCYSAATGRRVRFEGLSHRVTSEQPAQNGLYSVNVTMPPREAVWRVKTELELVAKLEEQHLFPVLRKHKETKDLVQDALHDNKQTRKLLADLERQCHVASVHRR